MIYIQSHKEKDIFEIINLNKLMQSIEKYNRKHKINKNIIIKV